MGKDSIDYLGLQHLVFDVQSLTSFRMSVWRPNGTNCFLGNVKKPSAFCEYIRKNPTIDCRCKQDDQCAINVARKTKEPNFYTCHAGLEECVFPMVYEERLFGFIMVGQIRLEKAEMGANQLAYLTKEGFDPEELKKLYAQLPLVTYEHRQSLIRLLGAITGYVYLNGLMLRYMDPASQRIENYIHTHLQQPLSLDSISEALHISKSSLCHQVQSNMKTTVNHLITKSRVEAVKNALRRGETLTNASVLAGFSSPSYCCVVFKKVTGLRPEEYRKQYIENVIREEPMMEKSDQIQTDSAFNARI